jgi:hypothetical protein
MQTRKIKHQAHEFFKTVTAGTIEMAFRRQQSRAVRQGLIHKRIPASDLAAAAHECRASLKMKVMQAKTAEELLELANDVMSNLDPHEQNFLIAAWKGSRRKTINSLK